MFFLGFVHYLVFEDTKRIGSHLCFCLQAKEVAILTDPLSTAVLKNLPCDWEQLYPWIPPE
jgi:hypothetical protein